MCLQPDLKSFLTIHGHCTGPGCGQSVVQEVSWMSLPSPTLLTTPHWGFLQWGLAQRQPSLTESGTAGNQPLSASGLLPHCERRDRKCSQEPQPGPAVSWETACSEDWIYEMLSVSQPSLRNTKQKTTFRYISEENIKHLVPFAGVHSKRKVGSTFAYHKRESSAKKSHIRVTLPKTELNVCLVLNVLMVEM